MLENSIYTKKYCDYVDLVFEDNIYKEIGVNRNGKDKTEDGRSRVTALALAVSFAGSTAQCQAAGNAYDTAVDAGFGETFSRLFHDKVAGSPLEAEAADSVDTASSHSHLIIPRSDFF